MSNTATQSTNGTAPTADASLFDLKGHHADLLRQMSRLEGEIRAAGGVATPEQEERLGQLHDALADSASTIEEKLERYGHAADALKAESEALEARADAIEAPALVLIERADAVRERAEAARESRERLLRRIKDELIERGAEELVCGDFSFRIRNKGGSRRLDVTEDVEDLPARWQREEYRFKYIRGEVSLGLLLAVASIEEAGQDSMHIKHSLAPDKRLLKAALKEGDVEAAAVARLEPREKELVVE